MMKNSSALEEEFSIAGTRKSRRTFHFLSIVEPFRGIAYPVPLLDRLVCKLL